MSLLSPFRRCGRLQRLRYITVLGGCLVWLLLYHTLLLSSDAATGIGDHSKRLLLSVTNTSVITHYERRSPTHSTTTSLIDANTLLEPEALAAKLKLFKPVMSPTEKKTLLDIAKRLDYITKRWNITYFLYGGALLGSYRHHDVIPWDDDLDVFVSVRQRYELFRAVSASSEYDVFVAGPRLKVWSTRGSRRYTRYPWGWPYVDVSFYAENATHVWDTAGEYADCVYPKTAVFPVHRRPLAGHLFSAPRDAYANLRLTYATTDCSSPHYSHKYETHRHRTVTTIPCTYLASHGLPFVHRTEITGGVLETLKVGYAVIQSLVIDEPSYAITEPYRLVLRNTTSRRYDD